MPLCLALKNNRFAVFISFLLSSTVIISRQQRRMQVMRIRQRDDRYRNKKKKKQQHGSTSHHHQQSKQLHPEAAYRRKPNPIRRYDTDVLSPVRVINDSVVVVVKVKILWNHVKFKYCTLNLWKKSRKKSVKP